MPELTTIGAGIGGSGLLALILRWFHAKQIENAKKIDHVEENFSKMITELQQSHSESQLYAARNFATKDDLNNAVSSLHKDLENISLKLDKVFDKLDRKADK